jgi:hypothetical protein
MIVLAVILGACLWIVLIPCAAYSTDLNKPDYIENLWPPPQTETRLGCYIKRYLLIAPQGTGVGVTIDTQKIMDLEELDLTHNDIQPFQNRFSLYVDGKQVSLDRRAEGGGTLFTTNNGEYIDLELAGWYFFGSSHFVAFGDHVAKIVMITEAGKALEYEWRFTIR